MAKKIRIEEASKEQINWLLAQHEELDVVQLKTGLIMFNDQPRCSRRWNPIEDPGQSYPILHREKIGSRFDGEVWIADTYPEELYYRRYGDNPLEAGIRCLLTKRFGDAFEAPDWLE